MLEPTTTSESIASPDTVPSNEAVGTGPVSPTPPSPSEESSSTKDDEVLGTTCADRIALGVLSLICLVVLTVQWGRLSGWGREPIEIERQAPLFHEHPLDPNTATWVELMQLEGLGEVLARRIVEDRETHGRFESIDDLARVHGIGAKTVEKLRPWLAIPPGD